jgi:hypothetical protein
MVDEGGEKQIDKSEKNFARLESQIGSKDDNSIARKSERNNQESFSSDTLRAVSDDRSNSLQITDGDSVLVDSHAKRRAPDRIKAEGGGREASGTAGVNTVDGAGTDGASIAPANSKVFIPGVGDLEIDTEAMLQAKTDPLRKADGSFRDNLVAYEYNKETNRFEIGTNIDEVFKEYVDKNGVVPFGGKVSCDTSKGPKSSVYASTSLAVTGSFNGVERDRQVINVNISDQLKVGGQNVFDGKPHRGIFPIAAEGGLGDSRHWKWIDATIQRIGPEAELVIYGLSSSDEKPTNSSQFDHVPSNHCIAKMKAWQEPQHAYPGDIWPQYGGPKSPDTNWKRSVTQLNFAEQVE